MHVRYAASQQLSRLRRRYPFLARLTLSTTVVTFVWFYILWWGERKSFRDHIAACHWHKWEKWPAGAQPHRLVFIADPQLVDPHTYPGRPWPLSSLTESYTDQYMTRNFRMINEDLDPDTIIFLGDLFDGGREWAPEQAKPLSHAARKHLEEWGITPEHGRKSWDNYQAALGKQHAHLIPKTDQTKGKNGQDLKLFRPGESGRWSHWGQKQWDDDLRRFSNIFLAQEQLYPTSTRSLLPAFEISDSLGVENGANEHALYEYASTGGKQRQLIASLPGNHDVGFGALVQLSVRDRFQTRFGDSNRIDVIGNHTFVSVDSPSMSAHSQYMKNGYESEPGHAEDVRHLWSEPLAWLDDLRTPASKIVDDALRDTFAGAHAVLSTSRWQHEVVEPQPYDESSHPAWTPTSIPKPQLPVVLLTHVPLYRAQGTECGKLRENGHAIRIAMGYQYQNVVTQSLSREIVGKVSAAGNIAMVFSGDDHDYCDVMHRYNLPPWPASDGGPPTLANIREITVKSFSWAMGVRKPGFQLVSLWNPVDRNGERISANSGSTIQSHMCLLPDQLSTFIDYALLFAYTLPALLLRAIIVAVGRKENTDLDDDSPPRSPPFKSILPRFQPRPNGAHTAMNGSPKPAEKFQTRSGRHRASSTSTSSNSNANNNNTLQVQRSVNARTRSISPAIGGAAQSSSPKPPTPLIEKAGYFPQVKWHDPNDDDSDEESHIGSDYPGGSRRGSAVPFGDDSQAKWKWRRRPRTAGLARRVFEEFGASLLVVAVPVLLFYAWLVKNG